MPHDARWSADQCTIEPAAVEAIELTGHTGPAGVPCWRSITCRSPSRAARSSQSWVPSGSGKSTLLYLLGGLDRPDGGTVRVVGVDWQTLRGSARARFLQRNCGFIAQGLALLPQATAAENVEVPLLLSGVDQPSAADAWRRRSNRSVWLLMRPS